MDPSSGSPPPPSDNEAATQHLKSLLGFFGVGVGASSSTTSTAAAAAAPVGGAGDAATLNNGAKMENGDIKDSLTNGVANPTSPDLVQTDSSSSSNRGVEASASPLETGASDSFFGVVDQTNSSSADSSAEKVIKSNPTTTSSRAAGFSAAPLPTPATPPKNHDCSTPGAKSERIELSGADEGNFYAISGERVEIVASEERTGRTPGSNKVRKRDRRRRFALNRRTNELRIMESRRQQDFIRASTGQDQTGRQLRVRASLSPRGDGVDSSSRLVRRLRFTGSERTRTRPRLSSALLGKAFTQG